MKRDDLDRLRRAANQATYERMQAEQSWRDAALLLRLKREAEATARTELQAAIRSLSEHEPEAVKQ